MKKLTSIEDIRCAYLDFFESKDHLIHDSYSLIPHNDDSLLLIGAGMAPIKQYFTGEQTPPRKRMATCQKCMRTGDLENVGVTARHATFFEMLGNFSFGDYFKREAIHWAWEFLTEYMEVPEELLWVTVYLDDDEAEEIWNKEISVPMERITRLGKEDNFWELEVGPSGPCSEIFVDRGKDMYGCENPDCRPGCDCDRFLEVWNLVFTQFDKDEEGNYNPLEHKNIDTGMGLERMAAYQQGKKNIYEIEEHQAIIKKIEELSGYTYGQDKEKDRAVRVIVDHSKAAAFMISDTIIPSNEGRGYVLRRLIRRAARFGRLLGINDNFIDQTADVAINNWMGGYPELDTNRDRIKSVITREEERFSKTIGQGMDILSGYIKALEDENKDTLDGVDAFRLYDTYGFPMELTTEILEEKGYKVDTEGFKSEMEAQRDRARSAIGSGQNVGWSGKGDNIAEDLDQTEFLGYDTTDSQSEITHIYIDDAKKDSLSEKESGIVILDRSPFYAEGGGQQGDKGTINGEGFQFVVEDTQSASSGAILHIGYVEYGELNTGDQVQARVEDSSRMSLVRNHSGTHLLLAALKRVLGEHVSQAGSEVGEKQFRFDFTHFEAVTDEELSEVEDLVNQFIYSATDADIYHLSLEEALKSGAHGEFEDTYGDVVRIVEYPGISKELCGGTHVSRTSDIGMLKILSESGVAAGVRRIEATTGLNVYNILKGLDREIDLISDALKTNKDDIIGKINSIQKENKDNRYALEELRKENLLSRVDELVTNVKDVNGVLVLSVRIDDQEVDILRDLADQLKNKLESGVVVIGTVRDGGVNFVTTVTDDLIKKALKAGDIVREVAQITGGGGGGRPTMATAGGRDTTKIDQALKAVYDIVKENLE